MRPHFQSPFPARKWAFLSGMREKTVIRNGERIVEVRSDAGKLLCVKTREGYELKCPRSKQICLIRYEDMLSDCSKCLGENWRSNLNQGE